MVFYLPEQSRYHIVYIVHFLFPHFPRFFALFSISHSLCLHHCRLVSVADFLLRNFLILSISVNTVQVSFVKLHVCNLLACFCDFNIRYVIYAIEMVLYNSLKVLMVYAVSSLYWSFYVLGRQISVLVL